MTAAQAMNRGDLILTGRLVAAVELIGHTGARGFEIAFDDECGAPEKVMWHATATYQGAKVWSRHYPYPAQAAEELLVKLMNGGLCKKCGLTTVVGLDTHDLCCFGLCCSDIDDPQTYRYLRSCEASDDDAR
jgi:hypothetical protein